MTQKEFILQMLKDSQEGVTCAEFERSRFGSFHKLASRISDLRQEGYDIIRIESHDNEVMKARYKLVGEPKTLPVHYKDGQGEIIFEGERFD